MWCKKCKLYLHCLGMMFRPECPEAQIQVELCEKALTGDCFNDRNTRQRWLIIYQGNEPPIIIKEENFEKWLKGEVENEVLFL